MNTDIYYNNYLDMINIQNPNERGKYRKNVENYLFQFSICLKNVINGLKNITYKLSAKECVPVLVPKTDFSDEYYYLDKELTKKIHVDPREYKLQNIEYKYLNNYKKTTESGEENVEIYDNNGNSIGCNIYYDIYNLKSIEYENRRTVNEYLYQKNGTLKSYEGDTKKIIRIINRDETRRIIRVKNKPDINNLKIICDVSQLQKQENALLSLQQYPLIHNRPLLNLFQPKEIAGINTVIPFELRDSDFITLKDDNEISETQRKFVRIAMGTNDFAILEGPPGSGKTTTLVELIIQECKLGHKILLAASTHIAVDNLLERIEPHCKDYGILPLRITSDEDKVLDSVKDLCSSNIAERKRREILNYIGSRDERSKAQELFYNTINDSKTSVKDLEKLLFESANLVCGTMIGILQAPIIQNNAYGSKKLFDLVIIDEASKTPFTEFLVPALYGSRFILSGDLNQLSPYTDENNIAICISGLLQPHEREICKSVYDSSVFGNNNHNAKSNYSGTHGKIILCKPEEFDKRKKQIDNQIKWDNNINNLFIAFVALKDFDKSSILKLYGANLLLTTPDVLKKIIDILPPVFDYDIKDIIKNSDKFEQFKRRRSAHNINSEDFNHETWEDAISWRVCKIAELRTSNDDYHKYEEDIEKLFPIFEIENEKGSNQKDNYVSMRIKTISSVLTPSVLELIQRGGNQW